MGRTERRVVTEHHRAVTSAGAEVRVDANTTLLRVQYMDLSWSEWQPELIRYSWGRMPLNLLEDGSWETVEPSPRRLTRLP